MFSRRFSTSLWRQAKTVSRNLPVEKKPAKPWEVKNISKDEFFGRKYGSISAEQRQKLNDKVARQRRARAERKEAEYGSHRDSFRESSSYRPTGLGRNPVYEYIYGTHPVLAALTGGKRDSFNRLFVFNPKEGTSQILSRAKKLGTSVVTKQSKGDMNILADNGVHNGVVLETKPLEIPFIHELGVCNPESGEYDVSIFNEILNTQTPYTHNCQREAAYPLGIYLDGITDPQNLGAIVRTAYYMGVDFIVVPEHDTARLGPVAAKAAAGSLDLMNIFQTSDSLGFVERVRRNGWNVISTSSQTSESLQQDQKLKHQKVQQQLGTKFIDPSDLSTIANESPVLLVMGSEGAGVRTHLQLRSDYLVGLSKGREDEGIVDSLNVSVACALMVAKCTEKV